MFQRYVLTAMLIILVLAAVCGAAAGRDAADTANTSIQQDPHVASIAGPAKSSKQLRCGLVTDASSNTIFALCPGPSPASPVLVLAFVLTELPGPVNTTLICLATYMCKVLLP